MLLCGCGGEPLPSGQRSDRGPLGSKLGVDSLLALDGLEQPVDVVRDRDGRSHIYAHSLRDAYRAQGYAIARDRSFQLDLLRRAGKGTLAAVLGHFDASLIDSDIAFRHIGLARVAAKQLEETTPEQRSLLEAYAGGVSVVFRAIRAGDYPLPSSVMVDRVAFEDWTALDTLVVGRLQSWLLSYSADEDIRNSQLLAAFDTTFNAKAEEPALRERSLLARDLFRIEPPVRATTVDGFMKPRSQPLSVGSVAQATALPKGKDLAGGGRGASAIPTRPRSALPAALNSNVFKNVQAYRRAMNRIRSWWAPAGNFGSNNWAVAPSRSESGHAMLASDPHLALTSPMLFWPVSIHVDDALDVGGIAFPGIPGIILGHNRHVAWGATVAYYDVTDVYTETLSEDGAAVVHQGKEVPIETVEEVIDVYQGKSVVYPVQIVPHHGPILPTIVDGQVLPADPKVGALSVRWTGMESSDELGAVNRLLEATDVDEAMMALRGFDVGAQNWMLADTKGNIAWTSHARVPYRKPAARSWSPANFSGTLPCLILPGDGSADWDGDWPDEQVPWAKNPVQGYLATANQDQLGLTHDNNPVNDQQPDGSSGYLSCSFALGFRQYRIKERLEGAKTLLALDDLAAIQGDHQSALGRRLAGQLLLALANARSERLMPGSYPGLAAVVKDAGYTLEGMDAVAAVLRAWGDNLGFEAASGIDNDSGQVLPLEEPAARASQATAIFNVWLVRLMARALGDEAKRVGYPSGTPYDMRGLLHLTLSDAATLHTYDPQRGDSTLWDDLDTPEQETRQERMVRALLDALQWLNDTFSGGLPAYRWGALHRLRFTSDVPLYTDLANPAYTDPVFGDGFPRPGDLFGIDAANHRYRRSLDDRLDFSYSSGPTQRFVAEMHPAGPRVRNALPGGAVADPNDPHFADQAERWRRNQNEAVAFEQEQVLAAAESRTVLHAP